MGSVVKFCFSFCVSSVELVDSLFIGCKLLLDLELISVVEVCLEVVVLLPPGFNLVCLVSRKQFESLAFLLFGLQIHAESLQLLTCKG